MHSKIVEIPRLTQDEQDATLDAIELDQDKKLQVRGTIVRSCQGRQDATVHIDTLLSCLDNIVCREK